MAGGSAACPRLRHSCAPLVCSILQVAFAVACGVGQIIRGQSCPAVAGSHSRRLQSAFAVGCRRWFVLPASQAVAFLSPWWQPSTREKKGQQRQQALHLSRAMQRQAIMPVVFKYCAVVSAGRGSAALAGLTLLTSDAAPSHRSGRDEVLCSLSVCEKG